MVSSLSIYAELLLNIRQVTVYVTLQSIYNGNTKIELSSNRKLISITQDGEYAVIDLPCQVAENASLNLPSTPAKELSFRLQVTEDRNTAPKATPTGENEIPWSASSMTSETQLGCRSCQRLIVGASVKAWKALPSENWAEMMDFWHCHKPDDEEPRQHVSQAESKGYAASSRLGPTAGTGLVDVDAFVLLRDDCVSIKASEYNLQSFVCVLCGEPLGFEEEGSEGVRLYKWNLRLRCRKDASWQTLPVQEIICAKLLALIEGQATYKFLIYSGKIEEAQEALMLWVFTPDIIYSATARPEGPRRAMKILYKNVLQPAVLLEEQRVKVEELQLPDYVLRILQTDLRTSTEILPPSAAKLQEWDVGLLER